MIGKEFQSRLQAPFHPSLVKSRKAFKEGNKVLHYIDARLVMDRLDEVFGPLGWEASYEFHGERTICNLTVTIKDEAGQLYDVTKSDGAGDTNIEGEKGGISDAFKRAAVHLGIGRYLYSGISPTLAWNQHKGIKSEVIGDI